ncbi:putative bifunctional diguanylate cyclase/phosphodiesterase [Kineococcus sp. SYSU DK006]|uniref:putative bifunctional diguanylate cyclase/phosphodiesterase n=1 Tax=Kineococcus sp. SYSU DK006 TaxID=3383127 RepID=UPI003D7D60D6
MTNVRVPWRAGLSGLVLACAGAGAVLAHARWDSAAHPTVLVGLGWLLVTAVAALLVRGAARASLLRYAAGGTAWGAATVLAGAAPGARVGPLPLVHLVAVLALLGMAVVVGRQLRHARADRDEQPLLVDALMLGTVMATVAWDGYARAGYGGDAWWALTTALVIAAGSFVSASAITLAIELPQLRRPGVGMAVFGLGTQVVAITAPQRPAVAAVAAVLAALGGLVCMATTPRGGLVRHGGAAAERAARRLEVASLVPGPLLVLDLVVCALWPRADPVWFVLLIGVLAAFAVRHAATARAVDRTTARLVFQAHHDPLTGLANRTALRAALTEPDTTQSLVLFEVAGLDDIGDVLGVAAGEEVLHAAAANLARQVQPLGGTPFRVRHDEVAVLLPGTPDAVARHVPALVAAIGAAPLQVAGAGQFPLDAVAGIACVEGVRPGQAGPAERAVESADPAAADPMAPLLRADLALRDARAHGAGAFSVYSGQVASAHARRLLLRERLAAAIAAGEVDVHYQPIVSFATGRVEKFEALARWDDPELGRISPVEFIAVAEESNLVVALGEHVLRRAVATARAAGVFAAGARLAVNVSVVQLQAPGFADAVRGILARHEVPAHLLTLELTESVFLDTDSPAERVVTELARLGCQIAIDDFGTGYSAFGYLDRLPVHVLKVDRSLTQSLTARGNGRSVVTAVVDLANRLGLTVVVEGVETPEEAAICRSISAGLGQGWLYSAAVTADRLADELERQYPAGHDQVKF